MLVVSCRATYAAEQSVQKLEKGKKDQDLLIDHLHQQVRSHEQQIAIYTQQYEAQRRETRAAKEMLAAAEAEMEGVHFEKRQLTAQWQSSLIATQRRDEALRVGHLICFAPGSKINLSEWVLGADGLLYVNQLNTAAPKSQADSMSLAAVCNQSHIMCKRGTYCCDCFVIVWCCVVAVYAILFTIAKDLPVTPLKP